jgi:hypothetical protein
MSKYPSYPGLFNKYSSRILSLILGIKFMAPKCDIFMLCYKITKLMSKLNIKQVTIALLLGYARSLLLFFFSFYISFAGEFPQEAFSLEISEEKKCSAQSPKYCKFKLKIYHLKDDFQDKFCEDAIKCREVEVLENYGEKYEYRGNYIFFDGVDLRMLATNYKKDYYEYIYNEACIKKEEKEYCLDFFHEDDEKNFLCYDNYRNIFEDKFDIEIAKYCFQKYRLNKKSNNQKNSFFKPYEIDNLFLFEIERLYINLYKRYGANEVDIKKSFTKEESFKKMLEIANEIDLYLVEEGNGSYQWLEEEDIGDEEIDKKIVTKIKAEDGKTISEPRLIFIAKKLQDHLLADDNGKYDFILRRSEKFNLSYDKRNIHNYSESRICAYIKGDENKVITCVNIKAPKFCPAITFRDKQIYEVFNSNTVPDGSKGRFATFTKTPAEVKAEGFCDYGDNLIESSSGKPTMYCRDDGTWDIDGFKNGCVRQKCPAIYITQNPTGYEDIKENQYILLQGSNIDGSYNNGYKPREYGYAIWPTSDVEKGVSATKCIAGYEIDGSLPKMTCGQYGKWNFESLESRCKRIVCEASSGRNNFPQTNASTSLQERKKFKDDGESLAEPFAVATECADNSYDMPTAGVPTAYCNYDGKWEFENLCTKGCENIEKEGKKRDYWDDNVNHEQSPNDNRLTTPVYSAASSTETYPFSYDQNNGFSKWKRKRDKIIIKNSYDGTKIIDERIIDGLSRKLEIKNLSTPSCKETWSCYIYVNGVSVPQYGTTPYSQPPLGCSNLVVSSRNTAYNIHAKITYSSREHTGS